MDRYPLPSNIHHRSNGDCLEGKRENYHVCSVQYCVQQLCTVQCTHMNRPNSSLDWVLSIWAHFTVLRFIFMVALCNRADHYIFTLFLLLSFFFFLLMVALCHRADHNIFMLFLLSSSLFFLFFPRLISAVGDWMFTILWHMVWPFSASVA